MKLGHQGRLSSPLCSPQLRPTPLQQRPQAPHCPCPSTSGRITSAAAASGNGAAVLNGNGAKAWQSPAEVAPLSPEVAAIVKEQQLDFETSGLKFLTNEARLRALDKKANKVEKTKNKKGGHRIWQEIQEVGELIRAGQTSWEDLDLDDIDIRLKWAGLFHRRKRTPGRFMMRLKVPNGEATSTQLRYLASCIEPYGEDGCADITTRANFQLRGITLAEADKVMEGLVACGLSSVMSGMDNVRNMTGSPIAGIDPHELIDVRPLNHELNDMITNFGHGNPELANLPRKINIGISPSRDDFPHTHINDVGLVAVRDPETGEVGFNLEVGGYFSIKRNAVSINGNTFITRNQVVPYCKALLEVFRDLGGRVDRQKARLMWLVEDLGVDAFREAVAKQMGVASLRTGVHAKYDDVWERRDVLGIHQQKQEGLFWVGACVPAGRLFAQDLYDFADVADRYGDGTVRLTVEENILIPNVPIGKLADLQKESIFQKYQIDPPPLTRGMVSCTGSQFCGVALIETKQRAQAIVSKLEQQLDIPATVRIHWTGCPNSCGQAQVGDIGLMGCPAKKDGKAVEGVRIFLGGTIGENATLASEFEKGIPCEEDVLLPRLRDLLVERFGASLKEGALVTA